MKITNKYEFPCVCVAIIRKLFSVIPTIYWGVRARILFCLSGIRLGTGVCVAGKIFINNRKKTDIEIGDHVVFQSRFENNFVGLTNPTVLDTLGGGKICIGSYSGFSSVIISSRSSIKIGEHVKIGGNVRIFDHDFHSLHHETRRGCHDAASIRTKPVIIEDDVFVGTNAIILKGTRLGARTIVATGSVVFGLDVPPDSLVKGNPACIIEKRPSIIGTKE
jgi:acetyltransferase-like isoleucine patch superfamily enzyme